MFVAFTVPIKVEGFFVADFEAAAEIKVISEYGGEEVEWEVESLFVDVGTFVKSRVNGRSRWVSQFIPAPGTLSGYIEDYMDTKEGRTHIEEQIMENLR